MFMQMSVMTSEETAGLRYFVATRLSVSSMRSKSPSALGEVPEMENISMSARVSVAPRPPARPGDNLPRALLLAYGLPNPASAAAELAPKWAEYG